MGSLPGISSLIPTDLGRIVVSVECRGAHRAKMFFPRMVQRRQRVNHG